MKKLIAMIAMMASSAAAGDLKCRAGTDMLWTRVSNHIVHSKIDGSGYSQHFECHQLNSHLNEEQCYSGTMAHDAYWTVRIYPERGLVVEAWGNTTLRNHVVTITEVSCS